MGSVTLWRSRNLAQKLESLQLVSYGRCSWDGHEQFVWKEFEHLRRAGWLLKWEGLAQWDGPRA